MKVKSQDVYSMNSKYKLFSKYTNTAKGFSRVLDLSFFFFVTLVTGC